MTQCARFLPATVPLLAGLLLTLPAEAGPAVPQGVQVAMARKPKLRQPTVPIQEARLENGLRILIVEQHHAPVVSVNVTYSVGSRDERPGRTGFAHLFEHMMFQGSENIGKAEHFVLIGNYGGIANGTTSFDRTNYFEMVPANQLEMALFAEADRMRSLDVSQENLDNQRNAVQEERRLRYDNQPYGTAFERLLDLTFDNFAYKHSTIGSMDDLNAASLADIHAFFKTYYAPNNATLVVVGDVKADQVLALAKKHFGNIPSQPQPSLPDLTEPLNKGERQASRNDPLARTPRIDVLYPSLRGDHPDFIALEVLAVVLGGNESSRLYQKLVKEKELATSAGSGAWMLRGPSPFIVRAIAAPGKSVEEIRQIIDAEIARVQTELVGEDELRRARTTIRADLVNRLASSVGLAFQLGELTAYFGDPGVINRLPAMYQSVTAEDLRRVAQKYLQPANRGVLYTIPAPKVESDTQGSQP